MIRTATLKDIPELLTIESKSFNTAYRFSRNQFSYAIINNNNYFRIYEELGCLKGYVYVLSIGRIYSIAAYPPNTGIGSILLERAEDFVRIILNKDTIKLEVKKGNNKAINFYTKHGYKPYGIKHNYYKDGKSAILMRKDLTQNAKG